MFVIRNDKGEVVAKSDVAFDDPRSVEVSEDLPIKQGIVWVTRAGAEIVDICDCYPANPDAQPVARDDPELVAYWAAQRQARDVAFRDPLAEIDALKGALLGKGVVSIAEIDAAALTVASEAVVRK